MLYFRAVDAALLPPRRIRLLTVSRTARQRRYALDGSFVVFLPACPPSSVLLITWVRRVLCAARWRLARNALGAAPQHSQRKRFPEECYCSSTLSYFLAKLLNLQNSGLILTHCPRFKPHFAFRNSWLVSKPLTLMDISRLQTIVGAAAEARQCLLLFPESRRRRFSCALLTAVGTAVLILG